MRRTGIRPASADRLIPALAIAAGVDDHQQVRIIENLGGGNEIHAMLLKVAVGLDGVPFKLDASTLYGALP